MPFVAPVPVQNPAIYEQKVTTHASRNLSQPEHRVTPLRYLGEGAEPALQTHPQTMPEVMRPEPLAAPVPLESAPVMPVSKPLVLAQPKPKPKPKPLPASVKKKPEMTVPVVVEAKRLPIEVDEGHGGPRGLVKSLGGLGNTPVDVVYFRKGGSIVTGKDLADLKHLDPKQCYLAVGFSDPTGSQKLVLGLSALRAESVSTVMRTVPLRVEAVGFGALGVSHVPSDYGEDRRTEVWQRTCDTPGIEQVAAKTKAFTVAPVTIRVLQLADGRWETTVSRVFATRGQAEAWADQVRHWPEIEAIEKRVKTAARSTVKHLTAMARVTGLGFHAIAREINGTHFVQVISEQVGNLTDRKG